MAQDLVLKVQYGEATLGTEPQPQELNTQVSGSLNNTAVKNALGAQIAVSTIKNVGQQLLGNIGNLTGDMRLQRDINLGMKLAGVVASFAINPLLGATAVVSEISGGVIQHFTAKRKNDLQANYLRKISGSTTNRSR